MPVGDLVQIRRGTAAQWTSVNPTLSAGEMGWESDTGALKIGDGSTAWNSLGFTLEPIVDGSIEGYTNVSTTPYTEVATDVNILVDSSGGNRTVNLRGAINSDGRVLNIIKTDAANSVTVDAFGSETINGSLTQVLTGRSAITLFCDSVEWFIR
jgi:hypothetical protein